MRADIRECLTHCRTPGEDGKSSTYLANKRHVGEILDAMIRLIRIPSELNAPAWITPQKGDPSPRGMLACANGLVHVLTRIIQPPTPRFFTLNSSPVTYDIDAPAPTKWLAHCAEVYAGREDNLPTLQEWMGLLLVPDTSFQKILLRKSRKRGGKGTESRIIEELIGINSIASMAAEDFDSRHDKFAMAMAIGKSLMLLADARFSSSLDKSNVAGRLLTISGEDTISINRKGRDHWQGRLYTRIQVNTNVRPNLKDSSDALPHRFIFIETVTSFDGREKRDIYKNFLGELPGILNWAIEGYIRLKNSGQFTQGASVEHLRNSFVDRISPMSAFIRDRCVEAPGLTCYPKMFALAYNRYLKEEYDFKHEEKGPNIMEALEDYNPEYRIIRPKGDDGSRPRILAGICVKAEYLPDGYHIDGTKVKSGEQRRTVMEVMVDVH